MTLLERIRLMNAGEIVERPEIRSFWDRGFLWTLAHRRAFKQFMGCRPPKDEFFNYETAKNPEPLSEIELALLCWAGAGTNGLIRNDHTFAQNACAHPWFEGRVYPSACNIWFAHLLFANDEGIFQYCPHVPRKVVEIDGMKDMETIFKAFKDGIIQLSEEPLWRAEQELAQKMEKKKSIKTTFGTEQMFQPGVTYFFPLVDITVGLLNVYLWLHDMETQIYDEEKGSPAGVDKWVEKDSLGGSKIPLKVFETGSFQILIAHQYYIHQNLQLCATAMGLGAYVTGGGYSSFMVLHEALSKGGNGIRFVKDKLGYEYPVGIDGVFEAHMPPYMTMDEAVQDVWNMKFKKGYGRYNPEVKEGGAVMYPGFDREPRAVHRPFKESEKYTGAAWIDSVEAVQVAKCVANYVYDTYGRFPKTFNPILCENFVQVSHIDTDFYEQYHVEGSIWKEQKEHLRKWHDKGFD